ncbi:MAG: hypothetical protein RL322_1387 [Pseudomonadota bacterium]
MTNSLTLSLVLLCALLIFLVLARELWRGWQLRRDRIRLDPRALAARPSGRGTPSDRVSRREPGFESFEVSPVPRREPDFALDPAVTEAMARPAGSPPEVSLTSDAERGSESSVARAPGPPEPSGEASIPVVLDAVLPAGSSDSSAVPAQDRSEGMPQAPSVRDPFVIEAVAADRPRPPPEAEPEPNARGPAPGAASAPPQSVPSSLPSIRSVTQAAQRPLAPAALAEGLLSPATDCIIELACAGIVQGEKLVPLAQTFRRCGTKPVLFEVPVLVAEGAGERLWRAPRLDDRCRALRIGILLDNRSGPLNAMEFSEFIARVQEIADRLGARFDAPTLSEVLQAARRLDADCAQLDWTAGLNVDAAELLGPAQLAALASPLVITERGSNRYARLDEFGDPVFSVFLGERPNRLTFLLDLPRVEGPIEAWDQMVECAWIAARRLPGRLVDDSGKALTERFLDNISSQVRQRALALEAVGLRAGSAAARRVFN